MRRLVCAFIVPNHRRQVFSRRGPYDVLIHYLLGSVQKESEKPSQDDPMEEDWDAEIEAAQNEYGKYLPGLQIKVDT